MESKPVENDVSASEKNIPAIKHTAETASVPIYDASDVFDFHGDPSDDESTSLTHIKARSRRGGLDIDTEDDPSYRFFSDFGSIAATAWGNENPSVLWSSCVAVYIPRDGRVHELRFTGGSHTMEAAVESTLPTENSGRSLHVPTAAAISALNAVDLGILSLCIFVAVDSDIWLYESKGSNLVDKIYTLSLLQRLERGKILSVTSTTWKSDSGEVVFSLIYQRSEDFSLRLIERVGLDGEWSSTPVKVADLTAPCDISLIIENKDGEVRKRVWTNNGDAFTSTTDSTAWAAGTHPKVAGGGPLCGILSPEEWIRLYTVNSGQHLVEYADEPNFPLGMMYNPVPVDETPLAAAVHRNSQGLFMYVFHKLPQSQRLGYTQFAWPPVTEYQAWVFNKKLPISSI